MRDRLAAIRPGILILVMAVLACANEPTQEEKSPFVDMGALPVEQTERLMDDVIVALERRAPVLEGGDATLFSPDRRRVFLRVYFPGTRAIHGMGAGDTLGQSLSQAVVTALRSPFWPRERNVRSAAILLAVERAHCPVLPPPPDEPVPPYDPLGYTLAISAGDVRMGVTPIDYLSHGRSQADEVADARETVESSPDGRLDYVDADTFVRLSFADKSVRLWRGRTPTGRLATEIPRAADRAARYVTRSQKKDGSFPDVYWPLLGVSNSRLLDVTPQALAVLALARQSVHTGSDALIVPLERAAAWLAAQITYPPDKEHTFMCVPSGARHATTSAAALTIMALDEYSRLKRTSMYDVRLKKLGEFLDWMIYDNGAVRDVYYFDPAQEAAGALPGRSYPVEVLPALIRLYERTGRRRWLDLAIHVADFAVGERTRLLPDIPVTHPGWLIMGLMQVSHHTGKKNVYTSLALTATQDILSRQCTAASAPFLEFAGGVWPPEAGEEERGPVSLGPPRSGSTADALMGLLYLEQHVPEGLALPDEIAPARVAATHFLLAEQFTRDDSFYVKEPRVAVGGVRENWALCEVSLETVARAIIAMSYYGRDKSLSE